MEPVRQTAAQKIAFVAGLLGMDREECLNLALRGLIEAHAAKAHADRTMREVYEKIDALKTGKHRQVPVRRSTPRKAASRKSTVKAPKGGKVGKDGRRLSPEALARIREGARKRWENVRAQKEATAAVEAPAVG